MTREELSAAANLLARLRGVRDPVMLADAFDLLARGTVSAPQLAALGWPPRRARRVVADLVRDLELEPMDAPRRGCARTRYYRLRAVLQERAA